jgi:PAS domain S-box-containing protein
MNSFSKKKRWGSGSIALRISITYFLIGALWILFSDKAVGLLMTDPAMLTTVSMIKGWAFVMVTALLLYGMIGPWVSGIERSREEARSNELKYRQLVESANSIIIRIDSLGNITFINGFGQRFFGYTEEELVGKSVFEAIVPAVETTGRDLRKMVEDVWLAPERYAKTINENIRRNGERAWVSWNNSPLLDEKGRVAEILCVGNDITERRQAEEERELVVEFLRLVNKSGNTHELVYEATDFFQKRSGCEAVGIRLKREHDYPYYETRGFPPEFVRLESRLCATDRDGRPILDAGGDPVLECMCGNVIRGRFDPSKPFFTAGGTFWTNSTTELLSTTTPSDRQARTRNRCNGEGYESVALIGLRAGEERIGLLQLNDRQKNRFTPRTIALWELLASYLAVALSKFLAQEALGESEQRYRELFEAGSDAILFVDSDTEMILDANSTASVLFGYSREELLTKRNWELSAEPEKTKQRTRGARARAGEVITVPLRHLRRKDGTIFPAEITARSFIWRERSVFIAAFRDITERKKAEEEKARLAAIVESSTDAIIGQALDGTITSWNMGARNIYQYEAWEVIGRSIMVLVPEGLSEDVKAILGKIESGELVEHYETVRRRKDGRQIEVSLTVSPILDSSGNIIGVASVARDITARRRAEERLIESERRYRALFENMASGFVLFEVVQDELGLPVDLVILTANKGFEATTGLKASEVVGKRLTRVLPGIEKDSADWIGTYGRVALTGESRHLEQGSELLGVFYSVTAYQAGPKQCCVTFQDITEKKRAEEERARMEARLRQAQKMEALGTLAGGIAHDFNNILGVIAGFTELTLLDPQDQEQVRENMGEVLMASGRARDLVKQILAFSRQSAQEKRPVQVGLIVKEALKMLRATLPATVEIEPDVASRTVVSADPTQIHQVLMNLCTNSAHAMFQTGGVLTVRLTDLDLDSESIRTHSGSQPGRYVKLSVSDTGHGIEPAVMERIFDPFFTTKGLGAGTGLGLAVVLGIAESLGGFVEVESVVGAGSTFHVFLPSMENGAPLPVEKCSPPPGGQERILIVDDEPALTSVVRSMLARLGYTAEVCSNGAEALRALRHQAEGKPFDLVITDMTMPHMTGTELAKEVLKLQPATPIILCTGYSEKFDVEKAGGLGIKGFLMKPVALKELAGLVRKVLDGTGDDWK